MQELTTRKIGELKELVNPDSFGGLFLEEKAALLTSLESFDFSEEGSIEGIENKFNELFTKHNSGASGKKYNAEIKQLAEGIGFIKGLALSGVANRVIDQDAPQLGRKGVFSEALKIERLELLQQNKVLKEGVKALKEQFDVDIKKEDAVYKASLKKLERKEAEELETLKKLHLQSMEAFEERETEEIKGVAKIKSTTLQAGVNLKISENNATAKERAEDKKMEQISIMLGRDEEKEGKKKIEKSEKSEEVEGGEVSLDIEIKKKKEREFINLKVEKNQSSFKVFLQKIVAFIGQDNKKDLLKIYEGHSDGGILNIATFKQEVAGTYGVSASLFNNLMDEGL